MQVSSTSLGRSVYGGQQGSSSSSSSSNLQASSSSSTDVFGDSYSDSAQGGDGLLSGLGLLSNGATTRDEETFYQVCLHLHLHVYL
jgi:hypothetical protein